MTKLFLPSVLSVRWIWVYIHSALKFLWHFVVRNYLYCNWSCWFLILICFTVHFSVSNTDTELFPYNICLMLFSSHQEELWICFLFGLIQNFGYATELILFTSAALKTASILSETEMNWYYCSHNRYTGDLFTCWKFF